LETLRLSAALVEEGLVGIESLWSTRDTIGSLSETAKRGRLRNASEAVKSKRTVRGLEVGDGLPFRV
jgi:hypothetical protein